MNKPGSNKPPIEPGPLTSLLRRTPVRRLHQYPQFVPESSRPEDLRAQALNPVQKHLDGVVRVERLVDAVCDRLDLRFEGPEHAIPDDERLPA